MTTTLRADHLGLPAALRERCDILGLPLWRCDRQGRILVEPDHAGLAGLFLRSTAVAQRLESMVAAWNGAAAPEFAQLFPGFFVVPIEERRRQQVSGYVVAGVLGPALLSDPTFLRICHAAALDPAPTRTVVSELARHPAGAAGLVARSIRWMNTDLVRASDDAETIAGFTRQLTDGFETIDLLYSLGRSMNDLAQPRPFVELVCERLQTCTAFASVAAVFGSEIAQAEGKIQRLVGAELITRGQSGLNHARLREVLDKAAARSGPEAGKAVIVDRPEPVDPDGPGDPGTAGASERRPISVTPGQWLVQPIAKPGRLMGFLVCWDKGGDDPQISSYDIHLLEAAAGYAAAFLENAALYADQQAMFVGTLRAMTASIDAKDRYTRGHSERVAHLARMLGRATGLPEATAQRLHIAGLVHDVGKIGVPEAVLTKPGRLTDDEFARIKEHPQIGFEILCGIPLLEDILPGVLHHHERWDGRGYPHGLSGKSVPLFARIIGLADTFDAMSSTRSYRHAMPREKVLAEIRRCAGAQFDPDLVEPFLALDFAEYDAMVARHAEQERHAVAPPPPPATSGPGADGPAPGDHATPAASSDHAPPERKAA